MALLRFILLIIFLYLILQTIIRFILRYYRKKYFHAKSDKQYSHHKRDGQVTVNYNASNKEKKISKEKGEYIKFEEIKKGSKE